VKNGSCVNATDKWSFSPLHEAAQKGRTQLASLLVRLAAVHTVHVDMDHGFNALLTRCNCLKVSHGADLWARTKDGRCLSVHRSMQRAAHISAYSIIALCMSLAEEVAVGSFLHNYCPLPPHSHTHMFARTHTRAHLYAHARTRSYFFPICLPPIPGKRPVDLAASPELQALLQDLTVASETYSKATPSRSMPPGGETRASSTSGDDSASVGDPGTQLLEWLASHGFAHL